MDKETYEALQNIMHRTAVRLVRSKNLKETKDFKQVLDWMNEVKKEVYELDA